MNRGRTSEDSALSQALRGPISGESSVALGPDLSSSAASSRRVTFVGRPSIAPLHRLNEAAASASTHSHKTVYVPELVFDMGLRGAETATMTGNVMAKLVEHCQESSLHGREVGGLLMGHVSSQLSSGATAREYQAIVTDAVPIRTFDSSSVHLNVTEDAWKVAEETIRQKHAPDGKVKVGWYHTHPDQGIFFSAKDRAAHEIFAQPYQFALVVDPRTMEAGLFHWTAPGLLAGPICFSLVRRGAR